VPYARNADLPTAVRNHLPSRPGHLVRSLNHAFANRPGDEGAAFRIAQAAVRSHPGRCPRPGTASSTPPTRTTRRRGDPTTGVLRSSCSRTSTRSWQCLPGPESSYTRCSRGDGGIEPLADLAQAHECKCLGGARGSIASRHAYSLASSMRFSRPVRPESAESICGTYPMRRLT
jgi:cation transport regulator ChaB